jgi:hypothetical protein
MQHRTNTARVALLLVVAALVLQATPALGATDSKSRVGTQLTGAVARHTVAHRAGSSAAFSSAIGSDFAPGGAAAPMVQHLLERPLEAQLLAAGRLVPAPASSPAVVRPRRE